MAFRDLQILKEEEKSLVHLHLKLSDQLNRLKVEELALTSHLRMPEAAKFNTVTGSGKAENTKNLVKESSSVHDEKEEELKADLDLAVSASHVFGEEKAEEEEEDDDDDDEYVEQDQLTAFLEELESKQK